MDDEGCFYVADSERHEVRCYSQKDPTGMGQIIVGGSGQGAGLHQLNEPRHIFKGEGESCSLWSRSRNKSTTFESAKRAVR